MPPRVCIIDLKSVLGWLGLDNSELVTYLRFLRPDWELLHYHQISQTDEVQDADCFVIHVDAYTMMLGREFLTDLNKMVRETARIIVYGHGAILEPSYFAVSDLVQVVPSVNPAIVAWNVTMEDAPQIPSCMGSDFSLLRLRKIRNYPIRTSRGCSNGCPFCLHSIFREYKKKNMSDIERELQKAILEYHAEALTIWDPCLNLEPQRFEKLLILLKRIGLSWRSNGLTYQNLDAKSISMLAESGCYLVSMGIESTSSEVRTGKEFNRRQLEQVIYWLKQAGIAVVGFFVIGLENDTFERAIRTVEYAQKLELDITLFSSAIAYPRTALYAYVSAMGRFLIDYKQLNLQCSDQINFETLNFPRNERSVAVEYSKKTFKKRNDTTKCWIEATLRCPYTSSRVENLLWDA